jgi:hypothetical protein
MRQLAAPLQHIVELPRAKRINLMGLSRPVLTSISTIAIENYADVARFVDAGVTPASNPTFDFRLRPDWLKMKNPEAPAEKREAEEEWGR